MHAHTHAQRLYMRGTFIYLFQKNNYTKLVIKAVSSHFKKKIFLADVFPT